MIIVTSIKVSSPNSSGKVSFSGGITSDESSPTIILKDVEKTDRTDKKGHPVYEGYVVSDEDAGKNSSAILDDPNTTQTEIMLCIHGNLVEPCTQIDACREAQQHVEKYLMIPLIWPAASGGFLPWDYRRNYDFAKVAGKSIKEAYHLANKAYDNVKISIMAHSLGNRALLSTLEGCNGEPSGPNGEEMVNAETVFMVAADVWEETFNDRVINGSWKHRDFNDDKVGLSLLNLTSNKVVVVHATNDTALKVSGSYTNRGFFKSFRRLGHFGKPGQGDRLIELAKTKIDSFDWTKWSEETDSLGHGYQFNEKICKEIYNKY